MTVRGCNGIVYEAHDARTEHFDAADLIGLGEAPALPLVEHAALYAGQWPDQGLTESCVGHAIAQAVYVRQGAMGLRPYERILPAPTDIYYRARAARHGWRDVVDVGSNPVAGWETLRDGLGVVAIEALPWDPETVDTPPDPALYRFAVDRDWLSYHWVLSDGEDRCVDVDALLTAGRPVVAALTCDQGILDWTPSAGPWSYRGPRKGGHYVCIIATDADSYWAINSWGDGYGVAGLLQIARSEIASSRTSYLATPEIRR
jgi:hypothetical protein